MGIGGSVFLLALGAILAFAVDYRVSGLDLEVVGVILMIAGALGLVLTMLFLGRRDTAVGTKGVVTEQRVVRERDVL